MFFPAALLLKHLPQRTVGRTSWNFIYPSIGLQDCWLKILCPDVRYLLSESPECWQPRLCVCLHFYNNTGSKVRFGHCTHTQTGLVRWVEVKSGHIGEHWEEGKLLGWHSQSIREWLKTSSCRVWRLLAYNPGIWSSKARGLPLVWGDQHCVSVSCEGPGVGAGNGTRSSARAVYVFNSWGVSSAPMDEHLS